MERSLSTHDESRREARNNFLLTVFSAFAASRAIDGLNYISTLILSQSSNRVLPVVERLVFSAVLVMDTIVALPVVYYFLNGVIADIKSKKMLK